MKGIRRSAYVGGRCLDQYMRTMVVDSSEVAGLGPASVLEAAAEADLAERRAAVRKLELAHQWALLHPATRESGVATPVGPALDVLDGEESLGGDGTPAVAAFTPEPFALSMGMSPSAGARMIADALDLVHRLPLLWQRVRRLEVPAWQARRVAQQTHALPFDGARWVDERLAAVRLPGPVVVDRLVAQASAEFDPERHQDREEQAQAGWGVQVDHPDPVDSVGTSHLTASGDTLILSELHDLVTAIAQRLHHNGDHSALGVRKIKALQWITQAAKGQGTLDLAAFDLDALSDRVRVYVHLDAADLDTGLGGEAALACGEVERLGAATLTKIRSWVGHRRVTVQPVLDLRRSGAVDAHDAPTWMRELVILRDGTCVFPGCTTPARSCDLDHLAPYVSPDDGGPPGQTRPDNLACLCRRHHRAKTLRRWRYQRIPDGHYLWQGPHGATYLTRPTGVCARLTPPPVD